MLAPAIIIKLVTLICLVVFMCISYTDFRKDHPDCFFFGARITAFDRNHTMKNFTYCSGDKCEKKICDYVSQIAGIATIEISDFQSQWVPVIPKQTSRDSSWVISFIMLAFTIISDAAIFFVNYKKVCTQSDFTQIE